MSPDYLEERPAALLVKEGRNDGDSPNLSHSVLGHVGTRVTAGDVSQCTHRRLNDVLPASGIVDRLQQSLGEREERGEGRERGERRGEREEREERGGGERGKREGEGKGKSG